MLLSCYNHNVTVIANYGDKVHLWTDYYIPGHWLLQFFANIWPSQKCSGFNVIFNRYQHISPLELSSNIMCQTAEAQLDKGGLNRQVANWGQNMNCSSPRAFSTCIVCFHFPSIALSFTGEEKIAWLLLSTLSFIIPLSVHRVYLSWSAMDK